MPSREQIILEKLIRIEDKLNVLEEKIDSNKEIFDKEVSSLRVEMKPITDFYERIQALGIIGRAIIFITGTLLAIAAAITTILRFISDPP